MHIYQLTIQKQTGLKHRALNILFKKGGVIRTTQRAT